MLCDKECTILTWLLLRKFTSTLGSYHWHSHLLSEFCLLERPKVAIGIAFTWRFNWRMSSIARKFSDLMLSKFSCLITAMAILGKRTGLLMHTVCLGVMVACNQKCTQQETVLAHLDTYWGLAINKVWYFKLNTKVYGGWFQLMLERDRSMTFTTTVAELKLCHHGHGVSWRLYSWRNQA